MQFQMQLQFNQILTNLCPFLSPLIIMPESHYTSNAIFNHAADTRSTSNTIHTIPRSFVLRN